MLCLLAAALTACGGTELLRPAPPGNSTVVIVDTDPLSGGDMTVFDVTSQAFGQPGPALSASQLAEHAAGDHAFDATFVAAPAAVNPGLGPRFDNVACGQCHVNDGRGAPYWWLPSGLMLSPRVSPPNFGLGLLEAVPEATIRGLALDPDAVEADVSGFANTVWDPTAQRSVLGRFGLKANVGSLLQQTVGALNADIGVTSSLLPNEPCDDPIVQHGQHLFSDAGCALCHIPTLQTGTVPGEPELSNQRSHPYTDLLLHDMGKALADGRPDYLANGAMWRTPPLCASTYASCRGPIGTR